MLPWTAILIAGEFALKGVVIVFILVRGKRSPSANLAWIVVIMALPLVGVLAYILVGETRLSRRRIDRHRAIQDRVHPIAAVEQARARGNLGIEPRDRPLAHLASALAGHGAASGNTLKLIGDTREFVDSLVRDIDAADDHCHLLYYIFLTDTSGTQVAEALIRAAERGVTCRLLVDGVGSRAFLRSPLAARCRQGGVHVVEALPARLVRMLFARIDLRNHRKIAVVDGRIGYTGSHNIADAEFAIKPRFAPWVDAGMRIQGPAVRDLQTLFIEDWFLDTDESLEALLAIDPIADPGGVTAHVIGTGPNSFHEAMHQLLLSGLLAAEEEIVLTTPYFVPDDATAIAIQTVARRGVTTHLVVPARNDSPLVAAASRSWYEPLLSAGVRIHEYQAGLLHAKTLCLDRKLAMISSANLDRRSFELNLEVSVVVYDSDFASHLRFLQMSYLDESKLVDAARWRRRGWPTRFCHNAAGMLGPLL